jgi:hypothetical protein
MECNSSANLYSKWVTNIVKAWEGVRLSEIGRSISSCSKLFSLNLVSSKASFRDLLVPWSVSLNLAKNFRFFTPVNEISLLSKLGNPTYRTPTLLTFPRDTKLRAELCRARGPSNLKESDPVAKS